MMGDLTASEKRLIAALDRIDYSIERAAEGLRRAETAPAPDPDGLSGENARLEAELAALRADRSSALSAHEDRLAQLSARVLVAEDSAARLAAANEALARSNRELMERLETGGPAGDDIRRALEAELDALRAARAAEVAQMDELVETLDRMLDPQSGTQPETQADGMTPAERN